MRGRALFVCTAAVAISCATAAAAQAPPPPNVVATVSPQAVTLQGAEALPAGPTRFEIRNSARRRPADVNIVALNPGVTVDALRAALARGGDNPRPFKRILSFEANGLAPPGGRYVTTINLKPGLTYVVLNAQRRLASSPLAVFTVGQQPSGAVAPAPAATVGLVDYAFRMPATLPRRGVVRFENRGERLHIAVAFRARRGVRPRSLVRVLRRGQERRLERMVSGVAEPLGLVSGGTVNDVEVNFQRPGNWVFACFIEDGERGNPPHTSLGMVRSFRVR